MNTNKQIEDGGSAFPNQPCDQTGQPIMEAQSGMSLRDYFAGQAIGALMASDGFEKRLLSDASFDIDDVPMFASQLAYEIADAMIAARKGGV